MSLSIRAVHKFAARKSLISRGSATFGPPSELGGVRLQFGSIEGKAEEITLKAQDEAEPRPTGSQTALFSASHTLALAQHLGIPYDNGAAPVNHGVDRLRAMNGAELLWSSSAGAGGPAVAAVVGHGTRSIPIFARVLSDQAAERLLTERGGNWSRAVSVTGDVGEHLASIWTADDGSVFLPFDPDEVCRYYWSERYQEVGMSWARRRASEGARRRYYQVRGLLPRDTQIWLRRRYSRLRARTRSFPGWPVETALHDFFDLFTSILAEVAGEPLPRIAAWPHGHTWALVLTHDVETAAGLAAIEPVLELERSLGLRSSWNFVPRRYQVDDEYVRALVADGFEVGVHGLYHDGRDLESLDRVRERLPAMWSAGESWGAVGFRSPSTQRQWQLMPLLGFDYDSSYPDTDPFEPQGGGCCTWLPFFNGEQVELPLTMPQDHTLFVILEHEDERTWIEKAEFLRGRGGMALLDTHPDYLLDERIAGAYRRLLERLARDDSAWKPLPRQVSEWWRRRAASHVEQAGTEWTVTGPAADEAQIELVEGSEWR